MSDCLFCKIAAGEIPSREVYSDEDFYAFEDIKPQAPTHVLVIPRKHITSLNDGCQEDEALLGHLLSVAAAVAKEKGIDYTEGNVLLLVEEAEIELIKKLLAFPEILEIAAINLEPQHLPYYAQELATSFHNFYEKCRVISEDEKLSMARLKLVEAARIVMARTLHLMGMNAPERM